MKMELFAYIDPGTGSLLLQMIVAGVVGTTLFLRKSIARIFGRGERPQKEQTAPQANET